VKFCGLTRAEDVDSAVELGASYVGFVFAPSARRTTAARVREMARHLPSDVRRVGVFADCTRTEILDAVATAELQVVQLHDAALLGLSQELRVRGLAVWSVAHVVDGRVASHAMTTGRGVDAVLVDTRVGKRLGGTGVPFDWEAA
jgi:phosphoribosylanthranilate isomerase